MDRSLATAGWILALVAAAVGVWMLWPEVRGARPDFEGGVELVYRPHLQAARDEGRVSPDEPDDVAFTQTMYAAEARVRSLGVEHVHVRREGDELFVLTVSDDAREKLDDVMDAIGNRDRAFAPPTVELAFRIVVEAWDKAQAHARAHDRTPRRLWSGDALALQSYKDAEVLVWQKARSDDVPYEPSRSGLRVAKKQGAGGDLSWDFVVVTEPTSTLGALFGGPILEHARVGSESGRTLVACDVKPPFQAAFRDFTAAHLGLKFATLVDREFVAAGTLMEPLDRVVHLFFETPNHAALGQELAGSIESGAAGGPLRVLCGFVEQRERAR